MTGKTAPVTVDIVSDVMCPWCYIGKKNLEAALPELKEVDTVVRWHPFQLDPTLPPEGKDRRQYLSEKFGGDERAAEKYAQVREAGKASGIDFQFEAIEKSPNTLDAHRLIRWAGGQGAEVQDKVVTRLFQLYFEEGTDIGDPEVLADVGAQAGMDRKLLVELLSSDADKEAVQQQIGVAQRMGVTGVPCFIVGEKYAVMGAQPPQTLVQAVRQVAKEADEDAQYAGKEGASG